MKYFLSFWSVALMIGLGAIVPTTAANAQTCAQNYSVTLPTQVGQVHMGRVASKGGGQHYCICELTYAATSCTQGEESNVLENTLYTWTGSCDMSCEAMVGNGTISGSVAVAVAQAEYLQSPFYTPVSPTTTPDPYYACGTRIDNDRDFVEYSADQDDFDYRIGEENGLDDGCDGIDNDGDGCIDEGLHTEVNPATVQCTPEPHDFKRLWTNGHEAPSGQVNLRHGIALRAETDITIEGPYGALSFARYYNSENDTMLTHASSTEHEINPLGLMWSHSFNVWLAKESLTILPGDFVAYTVHVGNGTEYYFSCAEDTTGFTGVDGNWECTSMERSGQTYQVEFDDTHLQRRKLNLRGTYEYFWEFYPGDGTVYYFSPVTDDGDLEFTKVYMHADLTADTYGTVMWKAEYDGSERLEYVRTVDSDTYYRFTHDSNNFLDEVYVNVGGRGEELMVDLDVDSAKKWLTDVRYSKDTIGTISSNSRREYSYGTAGSGPKLWNVKDKEGTALITVSHYGWYTAAGNDQGKIKSVTGPSIDVDFSYDQYKTIATYPDSDSGDMVANFTHDGGRYIYKSDKAYARSSIPRYVERDNLGRPRCVESHNGVMTKYFYEYHGSTDTPERHTIIADYGTTSDCENEPPQDPQEPDVLNTTGTLQRLSWEGEMFDVESKSWRAWYSSEMSPVSGYTPSTCLNQNGAGQTGLPNGCSGTFYEYQDAGTQNEAKGPVERVVNLYYTKDPSGTLNADSMDTVYFRGEACDNHSFFPNDVDYQYDWQVCGIEQQDEYGTTLAATFFDYDSDGLIEATSNYASASKKYTSTINSRDDLGRVNEVESINGVITEYDIDGFGLVTETSVTGAYRSPSGTDTSYTLENASNDRGVLTEITFPLGNKQTFTYDSGSYARPHAVIDESPSASLLSASRVEEYTDQGFVKEVNVVDIAGEASCSDEDCTTIAARNVVERDAVGRPLVTHQYTSNTSDPADATATNSYHPYTGQLVSTTDFVGNETEYTYDLQGRLEDMTSDINGLSATQNREYDEMNHPEKTTSPNDVETEHTYDDRGLLLKESSESQGDKYYEYDDLGRLIRTIHVDYFTSNPTTDPDRKEVCYEYDWLGRTQAVDEGCNSNDDWTYVYDESFEWCNDSDSQTNLGRLTTLVSDDYDGMNRKWCYFAGGSVESVYTSPTNEFWHDPMDADQGGFVLARGTRYVHDYAGRLTNKVVGTYPGWDDQGAIEIAYEYDSERVNSVESVLARIYYFLGWGSWMEITSTSTLPEYSVFGMDEMTLGNGLTVEYTRDKAGRVSNKFIDDGTNTIMDVDLDYDANSNLVSALDSGYLGISRYFEYDGLNRLECESSTGSGCPVGAGSLGANVRVAFDYDLSNNRTWRRTKLGGTSEEVYNQYTSSDRLEYYDVDNVTQYLWYDDQGNVEAVNYPVSGTDHMYWWNVHGQMEGACSDGDYFTYGHSTSSCTFRNFDYAGPNGQLFKRYDGSVPGIGTETGDRQFYWSGAQLDMVREFDGDDEKLGYYIWLGGRPIAKVDTTMVKVDPKSNGNLPGAYSVQFDSVTWIHTEYTGAPVVATDDSASVVWEWDKSPYGRNLPSGSVEIDLRFPGQVYDEYADTNYNQNRWYSTQIGQYLSPDPIGLAGGMNYYGYADGNPTSLVDVDGLQAMMPGNEGMPTPPDMDPECQNSAFPDMDPYGEAVCAPRDMEPANSSGMPTRPPSGGIKYLRTSGGGHLGSGDIETPGGLAAIRQVRTGGFITDSPNTVVGGVERSVDCELPGLACWPECLGMFYKAYGEHFSMGGAPPIVMPYCPSQWFTPNADGRYYGPSMLLSGCDYEGTSYITHYSGLGHCRYKVFPSHRWGKPGAPYECSMVQRGAFMGVPTKMIVDAVTGATDPNWLTNGAEPICLPLE